MIKSQSSNLFIVLRTENVIVKNMKIKAMHDDTCLQSK